MRDTEINELLEKYTSGKASPEEVTLMNSLFSELAAQLPDADKAPDLEQVQKRVWNKLQVKHKVSQYVPIMRYAAAILIIIGTGWTIRFALISNSLNSKTQIAKEITPGGNHATLTLVNGTKVNLEDIHSDTVANVSGVVVTNNTSNGVVTFGNKTDGEYNHHKTGQITRMNIISTPSGGQYQLILPDGSHVFLNSASTLQFPTCFAANFRNVILTGEAYFEIKENPQQPFTVATQGQTLTVLGTHFNISAYPNETIKTTLSAGRVQLQNSSSLKKQILQPEQQALLTKIGFELRSVNSTDEMAWKDGLFVFKQTPIEAVLHQLCRWYSVEANFSNLPDITVAAELSRKLTLTMMLKGINFGIRNEGFKIELKDGRRLEISKN